VQHLAHVAVRRGDDPQAHAQRALPADTLEFAVLQHAQQAHLRRRGQLAELVEKERAAVRALEPAAPQADRAGEAALLVAEELGVDELRRDGAAVDLEERAARARCERPWTARATTSLPEPVSPRMSTGTSVGATWSTSVMTCRRPPSSPTMNSSRASGGTRARRARASASATSRRRASSSMTRSCPRATRSGSARAPNVLAWRAMPGPWKSATTGPRKPPRSSSPSSTSTASGRSSPGSPPAPWARRTRIWPGMPLGARVRPAERGQRRVGLRGGGEGAGRPTAGVDDGHLHAGHPKVARQRGQDGRDDGVEIQVAGDGPPDVRCELSGQHRASGRGGGGGRLRGCGRGTCRWRYRY
jgi:hypothetical protein